MFCGILLKRSAFCFLPTAFCLLPAAYFMPLTPSAGESR
jgi:hypothetical protein